MTGSLIVPENHIKELIMKETNVRDSLFHLSSAFYVTQCMLNNGWPHCCSSEAELFVWSIGHSGPDSEWLIKRHETSLEAS